MENHGKGSVDNENEKSMLPRWPEENLVHGERVESREIDGCGVAAAIEVSNAD